MAPVKINPIPTKKPAKKSVKLSSVKQTKSVNKKAVFRPDAKQTATLIKAGRIGAANAIRASKALGLSITYLRKGVLYLEKSDGTKTIIANTDTKSATSNKPKVLLKKGMIFHEKK